MGFQEEGGVKVHWALIHKILVLAAMNEREELKREAFKKNPEGYVQVGRYLENMPGPGLPS